MINVFVNKCRNTSGTNLFLFGRDDARPEPSYNNDLVFKAVQTTGRVVSVFQIVENIEIINRSCYWDQDTVLFSKHSTPPGLIHAPLTVNIYSAQQVAVRVSITMNQVEMIQFLPVINGHAIKNIDQNTFPFWFLAVILDSLRMPSDHCVFTFYHKLPAHANARGR